ncbi:hypothetical protein B0H13DRAFT_2303353 [Mycena leptocephala]|nr:hypothetical protein B0H13DRAFT_2303353 [Mycena leptocephala]
MDLSLGQRRFFFHSLVVEMGRCRSHFVLFKAWGDIVPGVSVFQERHTPVARDRDVEMRATSPVTPPPLSDDHLEYQSRAFFAFHHPS